MNMRDIGLVALWSVAMLAVSGQCWAAGQELPALGSQAIGRGSAFTARADNPSAFYFNPAGLTKARGVEALVSFSVIRMDLEFDRGGSGEFRCPPEAADRCSPNEAFSDRHFDPAVDPNTGLPYERVAATKWGPLPMAVLVWGQPGGIAGLSLAAGVQPPSAVGIAPFDNDGAQRYTVRSADAISLQFGLGAAYEIAAGLSLGVTLLNAVTTLSSRRAARSVINSEAPSRNEDPGGDNSLEVTASDYFSPAASAGALYAPIKQLEAGLNVRTPVVVSADGDLSLKPGTDSPGTVLSGTGLTFRQKSPWVFRAGLRFVRPSFDIELDYVFEYWSDTSSCDVDRREKLGETGRTRCDNGIEADFDDDVMAVIEAGPVQVRDFVVYRNFRDSHSLRLGSDVELVPNVLVVRGGLWFQTSAYPENHSTFGVDFPISQQVAFTTGTTWSPGGGDFALSAGFSHIIQPDVHVSEGEIIQRGSATADTDPVGNIVNNGTYRLQYNVFSISAQNRF
ncbi:MAG: outer membrane protein transport protein [Polyangiaceae bacterium]|nr:outer membrane protein transport protein [Polyangiaceae bacterium]